jgi:Alpha-galactosidase
MKKLFVILLLFVSVIISAQTSSVITGDDNRSWTLQTKSAIYQINVDGNGKVNMMYFGDKSQDVRMLNNALGEEVTVRGGFTQFTPMVEVIFPDKVRDIELIYDRSEIKQIDGYSTLVIYQKDKFYSLSVTEFLRVLPEYDIIEKWIELENTGKKGTIKIENIQSGTFFLPKDFYELTHFSGIWGTEFQPHTTKLTQGIKTLQVKDFRSFGSSSFIVRPEGENDETAGKAWFGSLHYSGNWRVDFEKYPTGILQVTSGINFWDQEFFLKPGQVFTAPKMSVGYTCEGTQGVSHSLTAYAKEKILPARHRDVIRPVLYNSWYATTFDVNEEHQLALAAIAKEIGVEMFVIDDGWFKGRINDMGGLGDWTVDKNKFPNGLQPMIEKINAMGLDFGIWIEPEMVNPNSDLYRAHPDWVFHYPNRTRHEGRNQLILNLAREDVYNYLYDSFYKLLKENNIKFIKWDMNKTMSDVGFPSAATEEQRAVRIKYVENLYRLNESLRKEFPDVWFENCASGGGRIDFGMMARTDFNWVSDNTDPVERIFIQYAYLNIFPANTMISWITHEDWHQLNYPLEYKFDVSMSGVLGIGYDITRWDDKEKAIAKEKITQYKDIRETVQFGTQYRLVSPYDNNRSIVQFVNKDKTESIIFVYTLGEYPNNAIPETKRTNNVLLRGLNPDKSYRIEGVDGTFKGDFLLNIGVEFPVKGAIKSRIFKLQEVG